MHIASICVFEGPVPSRKEVEGLFHAKLPQLPRYRQRLRFVPFELGRPVWVDDTHFDLNYHVRRTALPAPHDYATLCALTGRVMSQLLDRSRPLWECWVVEGLEGGKWAMICKVHHSFVDGVAGQDLLGALLDREQDATHLPPAEPWTPETEPTDREMVKKAWEDFSDDAKAWGKRMLQSVKRPRETAREVRNIGTGLWQFARESLATPPMSLQGKLGAHRMYAQASVSMSDVALIRKGLGGTVNDVALTAVSAGYRALLAHRGDNPDKSHVRTLVPVSIRAPDARGVYDNRVSAVFCDLMVHIADPVARLKAMNEQMKRLKSSHMIEAGAWMNAISDVYPPIAVSAAWRTFARINSLKPQRYLNAIITNIPGPREALYFRGRKLLDNFPFVPIMHGVRVGTAILSYNGRLGFGLTSDYDAVPDVDIVARTIEATIAEMVRIARSVTHTVPALTAPLPSPVLPAPVEPALELRPALAEVASLQR